VGSAFVVASSGGRTHLLTNYHVVVDGWGDVVTDPRVTHGDGTLVGEVVSTSPHHDLAVIEVPGTFPALTWAAERPRVGDSVMALGSPLGFGGSVSSGIVSAFRTEEGLEYVQFSAPVSPGNSGGPVVDRTGAVVGVTVAKIVEEGAEGLSFAIPSDRACHAVDLCHASRPPLRTNW
jgi:putative serine protease PepD